MHEHKMIEVLARIEDEREAVRHGDPTAVGFNMDTWYAKTECGTVACFAGHAALAEGWLPSYSGTTLYWTKPGEEAEEIESLGADILGISEVDATDLFYLENLGEVYKWVADRMGVAERVLRDKVTATRTQEEA